MPGSGFLLPCASLAHSSWPCGVRRSGPGRLAWRLRSYVWRTGIMYGDWHEPALASLVLWLGCSLSVLAGLSVCQRYGVRR